MHTQAGYNNFRNRCYGVVAVVVSLNSIATTYEAC